VNTNDVTPILLHQKIAARIKPHQIKGLQFMWREIIEDPKKQGCILAHTMGLGKTMQVTSLLVTIALCNKHGDPAVRNLIPKPLQSGKTLILCPASLLINWEDELLMWAPQSAGLEVFKADSIKDEDNINTICSWSKRGGILILSYDRFRRKISEVIKEKKAAENEDGRKNEKRRKTVAIDLEAVLLDEPSLVIADEAHYLKNSKSIINIYAMRFATNSRIALTGSPLSNHLEEYHTMVDWIAPGYLGNIQQFRAKYSEPIREGLYADSLPSEKRLSMRKLHVLKRDLDPKIDRADISAIEKDMPSKTEYFITIPLTDLQKQAYNIYVDAMLKSLGSARATNTRIWEWIALLGWLCHHPSGFVRKLKERLAKKQAGNDDPAVIQNGQPSDSGESSDEQEASDEASTPSEFEEDFAVDASGHLRGALQQALTIFPDVDDDTLEDPNLSNRTVAVQSIVEKASEAGDKTLIFSHSIPTLKYLSRMLERMDIPFLTVTGATKTSERQNYTKEFNNTEKFKVLLISMRAGGLGLNLQGANRVIIFDFSFNPTWEQQAVGRAYRLNQKRPVFVYRFRSGGTFEDRIFNTSVFKTQLFGRVVDKKNLRRHATKDTGTEHLFAVKDVPQREFGDCIGKDPKVLDRIIHQLDFVRNIVLTETFQKEDDEQLTNEERKEAEEEYEDQRLQRDDPEAWYKRRAEREAELRKQHSAQHAGLMGSQRYLLGQSGYSTPMHPSLTRAIQSSTPRQSTYNMTPPPFSRETIGAAAAVQPARPTVPAGSFDDTFGATTHALQAPNQGATTP
jgi:SNF2 family DNA or RNA helicase